MGVLAVLALAGVARADCDDHNMRELCTIETIEGIGSRIVKCWCAEKEN